MTHAARAHVTWMSVVIMIAVTSSCITWLIVSRENKESSRARVIHGISEADIVRVPASTAHCLFKVNNISTKGDRLAWVKMDCANNISLDDSKMWITVGKQGVYLVYVQLTYGLKKDKTNCSVDLMLNVELSYAEDSEEFIAAFDTRQLTENETDAHLSAFLLLNMKVGNRLSILTHPKEMIKYNDIRPFSSYITIIRYADF